ncbi:MAG: hypothetical protein LUE64_05260 [Candidatus Gastranaerophilales bacterium]|nr:hypothetical protein [Candidatus Gastranaerophilales bacterium]
MQISEIKTSDKTVQQGAYSSAPAAFRGGGAIALEGVSKFFQLCDDVPMIGVSVTDTLATNLPRTMVDLKKTGVPAAKETGRREFSGLIVNCLIPGAFVYGAAKVMNDSFMKDFTTSSNKPLNLSGSWANGEAIKNLTGVWKEYSGLEVDIKDLTGAQKDNALEALKSKQFGCKGFVKSALSKVEGLNGTNKWDKLSDHKEIIDEVADILEPVMKNDKPRGLIEKFKYSRAKNNAVKQAYSALVNGEYSAGKNAKKIVEKGGGFKASHTLKFDGKNIGSDLRNFLRDTVDVGSALSSSEAARINPNSFAKKATGLVNAKSIGGLAVVIPLAMSMQFINRAITRHKYKKSGAPIYKDFENEERVLTDKEKKTLKATKPFAVGSIVGLAALSMGKTIPKSLGAFAEMLQFNTKFPSLNQCRVIATSTFASRMIAAEDPNELRESTVRDLASFAGLYFLGDYAEKLAATGIQKFSKKGKSGELQMFNKTKDSGEYKNSWQKFVGWVKDTNIKTFDEIPKEYKNYRSLAKLGGLGFSLTFLGILLPMYNKHVTNKKEEKRKALLEQQKNNSINAVNRLDESKPAKENAQGNSIKNTFITAKWAEYKTNPAFSKVASKYM